MQAMRWPVSNSAECRARVNGIDAGPTLPRVRKMTGVRCGSNVRSSASLKSQVVTSAEMGEIYKVLGKKGDWVQLGYYDNSSPLGWIRHDLVFGE